VVEAHEGEGQFPTFLMGAKVKMNPVADEHFLHWHACVIEGHQTYAPASFVDDDTLRRDYNPTELVAKQGDVLEVREIVNAWLYARNATGVTGWIPAESVVSY